MKPLHQALVKIGILLLIIILFSNSCIAKNSHSSEETIVVGAEKFSEYLPLLQNKRVGLMVNPTSRTKEQHLVDALIGRKINVSLIFAPEHGFRGEHGAGETVKDSRDLKTGIKIVSLHGKNKKPQPEQLNQVDVLIFDIQDVGVRFYTYISSMHYLMEACAENDIPLIVLDRPNPNGDYIDGSILEEEFKSFVGMHSIPIVHGLTVGELALMINGEAWLGNEKQCDLTVIKVLNYDHNTRYSLPIKPSPNLPNDLSVRLYPSLAFFEATPVSVGRGTEWPFQVLGYSDKNMGTFSFKPKTIRGSWKELNHAGDTLYGEKIKVSQHAGITLKYLVDWYARLKSENIDLISRPSFLDKLSGSSRLREQLATGMQAEDIQNSWIPQLLKYQFVRKKYLLYPDSQLILDFERNKSK